MNQEPPFQSKKPETSQSAARKLPLNIQEVIDALTTTLPASFRVIPEIRAENSRVSTLRIATPFYYQDGEQMYAYVEVHDKKNRVIRIHDDGVLEDWLRHHDLYRTFLRSKKKLEKELKPLGFNFTKPGWLGAESHLGITSQLEEAEAVIGELCFQINAIVDRARAERNAPRLLTSLAGGLAFA